MGHVKLECINNPYRRRDYNKEKILSNVKLNDLYDKGAGTGNLCDTFNKCTLGVISEGKWIGDETAILNGELPQIYSALCVSEVKAYQLSVEDFKLRFPSDI